MVLEHVQQGRPNLDELVAGLPADRSTLAMVCGPEALISAVSETAFRHNFRFFEETFNF